MPRLAAIRHRAFGPNPQRPEFPGLTDLFAERLAAYGVPVEPDLPSAGNRNSYSRLAAALLPELGPPPDAVVVAHCLPDCDLSTSIAGYLQQRVGGQPLIFAVTEQGRTTPFVALRMALDLVHSGGYRRVAMLVLDQGTFVYSDPALDGVDRETDHAVGLVLAPDGPVRIGPVRHLTQVAGHHAAAVLDAELDRLPLRGDVTLVAGPDVPPGGRPYRRRSTHPGQLCTGVWSELAAQLAGAGPHTVLAVEYEPALGYLCLAAIEVPPTEEAPR